MGQMSDWYADIAAAAEELGYIVESVDYRAPGRVVLSPPKHPDSERVIVEGIFTSGTSLRRLLRPIAEKVPA
jgi:hypothetical protein